MLIVPPNARSVSFAARSESLPGIARLGCLDLVPRALADDDRRDEHQQPHDEHQPAPAHGETRYRAHGVDLRCKSGGLGQTEAAQVRRAT